MAMATGPGAEGTAAAAEAMGTPPMTAATGAVAAREGKSSPEDCSSVEELG